MAGRLDGMKVAILATDGFEESELKIPHAELERQGALVEVVSLKGGEIQGWKNDEKSGTMKVDRVLDRVLGRDRAFDALRHIGLESILAQHAPRDLDHVVFGAAHRADCSGSACPRERDAHVE